ITTLVSNLIESDSSLDEGNAAQLVQSSLGIGGVDVLNFDMFEAAGNENPAAAEVIKAASMVQDTIVQAGSFLSGASTISKAASYDIVSEVLIRKIKEQQPIELSNAVTLEAVIQEAVEDAQVVVASASIKAAAVIISDSNKLKELAVDSADSINNAAQEISRVQGHAQSESQSDLADLGAGIQTVEELEIKYEAENLEKLVEETAVGPVSGVDQRVGTFAFSSAAYEVKESGEEVSQIKITRSEGNLGAIDLLVTPQAVTASSDVDFVSDPIALRFENQEITKTLSLEDVLIDDQISDAGESFALQLNLKDQDGSPAEIGDIAVTTVQIIDNDFAGTFQFRLATKILSEADSDSPYLLVERLGGNSGAVTVGITEEAIAGGATSGVDYSLSQTSITFGDGILQRKVQLTMIDDEVLEPEERFRLKLSLAAGDLSGARLGGNPSVEIRIQSDEVDAPPVISAIEDFSLFEGEGDVRAIFTFVDDYTDVSRLSVRATSSNPYIIPTRNLRLIRQGDGLSWQVHARPIVNVFGNTQITIKVYDGTHVSEIQFSISIKNQNDVPEMSAIPSVMDAVGQGVVIPFVVTDNESPAEDLIVYIETKQIPYLTAQHVTLRGTGSNRELVINPLGTAQGVGTFTLVVLDQEGARSSRVFTVDFGGEGPEPVVPRLTITHQDGVGITLAWEGDFVLYRTQDLVKPFQAVPEAVSPYQVDMVGQAFFKLRVKP
ncbi:MAG TPA: hypothetical protein EYQ50_16500, partial [Verrucomicrobiales bacterium]|nr:hypothetical protein [Verrucomicrobiales bacterium]